MKFIYFCFISRNNVQRIQLLHEINFKQKGAKHGDTLILVDETLKVITLCQERPGICSFNLKGTQRQIFQKVVKSPNTTLLSRKTTKYSLNMNILQKKKVFIFPSQQSCSSFSSEFRAEKEHLFAKIKLLNITKSLIMKNK